MNIEEAIEILESYKESLEEYEDNPRIIQAIETLYTAYEKEKRLAEANLKDSEEFQDNMCNHRCILNSKVEELEAELEKEKEKNKKIKDILQKYEHTQVGDEDKILDFYKELKETFI